jgi:hypothetical protein
MTSRIWEIIAFASLGMVCASAMGSAKIAVTPLNIVVAEARAIFVAKVLDADPVEFEFDQNTHVCGFRYRAQIERAFKGPSHTIEFFDPSSKNPLKTGDRFLAFLFSYDVDKHESEAARSRTESDLRQAEYLCQIKWINLTAKEIPRTLIRFLEPFDSTDWLEIPELGPSPPREVRLRVVEGRNVARWDDMAQQIEQLLREEENRSN